MAGNKVARFDPASQTFKEWDLPRGHHPHGLLVDRKGIVWTTGNGNGTIGLDSPPARCANAHVQPDGGYTPGDQRRR
jgi:virginiamycin B lyase